MRLINYASLYKTPFLPTFFCTLTQNKAAKFEKKLSIFKPFLMKNNNRTRWSKISRIKDRFNCHYAFFTFCFVHHLMRSHVKCRFDSFLSLEQQFYFLFSVSSIRSEMTVKSFIRIKIALSFRNSWVVNKWTKKSWLKINFLPEIDVIATASTINANLSSNLHRNLFIVNVFMI